MHTYRNPHITGFVFASLALHALLFVAAVLLIKPALELPIITPIRLVNVPQQELPRIPDQKRTPVPVPQPQPRSFVPEKPVPPGQVPMPRKFGSSDDISIPRTTPPSGKPEGAAEGKSADGATGAKTHRETGPLPFLSQNDIDVLSRKGMPERAPGDDSVTLDTDEFKFISYNRWLKIKIESVLKYPELAAASGYQGTLYIKFDIMKDGSLGAIEVLKSSGYKILDDEALRSIRSSAPFQPLPDDWNMDRFSIRAAVIFYLGVGYIR
jgi:protein TonB